MFPSVFRVTDYLTYLLTSVNRHGIHSPFVFNFNEKIIQGKDAHDLFDPIETLRRKMIKSKAEIDFVDFGSGNKTGKRKISEIADSTAKQARYGRFLYRLLATLQPQYSLELGTGTGIASLYQACAFNEFFPLHSIEGSPKLAEIAAYNAEMLGIQDRIHFHVGRFEDKLPEILSLFPRLDYVFIDGNHSYEPTIKYFNTLKKHSHSGTVLVFDDINWSEEMKRAWSVIKNDGDVTLTIDIFALGLVFFRKENQEKENFIIRY